MQKEKRIYFWAILIGLLTDIICTIIVLIALGVLIGVVLIFSGANPANMEQYAKNDFVLVVSMFIGLLCSLIGGFITGRLAKSHEIFNAAVNGFIVILTGLLSINEKPLWHSILSPLLFFPIVILGGYLATLTKSKSMEIEDHEVDETETDLQADSTENFY